MNHPLLSMNDWAAVMLCQQRLSRPAGLMSQVYQMCSCATQKTLCDTEKRKKKNKKEPVSWSVSWPELVEKPPKVQFGTERGGSGASQLFPITCACYVLSHVPGEGWGGCTPGPPVASPRYYF